MVAGFRFQEFGAARDYSGLMDLLAGIGVGAGLAAVAGLRAFLPLIAMLSVVLFAGFGNPPWMFMQINNQLNLPVIGALLTLLVLESVLDKSAALGPRLDRAMVPVRSVAGAAVFGMASVEWNLLDPMLGPMSSGHYLKLPFAIPYLTPYLIAGAAVAGVVAALKERVSCSSTAARTPRSRVLQSLLEDAVALVGVVVALLAPVLVAVLLFSRSWTRRQRGQRGVDPGASRG